MEWKELLCFRLNFTEKKMKKDWKLSSIVVVIVTIMFFVSTGCSKSIGMASNCNFEQRAESITLSNDYCKIIWNKTDAGWVATMHCNTKAGWKLVAYDMDAVYAARRHKRLPLPRHGFGRL